jgi:hypothetical protein
VSGFSNPIAGASGSLTIPQLQSPDYVAGVSGWRISKNGDAEFNNVETRGSFYGFEFIINDSGAFFYSGTPAAGNLAFNLASASGSDQFGNSYLKGFNLYAANNAVASLVNNTNALALEFTPPGLVHLSDPAQVFGLPVGPGAANERLQLTVTSGKENSLADAAIQLLNESADGTIVPEIIFEFGGTPLLVVTQQGLFRDSFHQATLAGSWAGSGSGANGLYYSLTAEQECEIIADIQHPTATGNSICFTLPAGYIPANATNHPAGWNDPAASNSATPPWVYVDQSGNVQVTGIEVANKPIFFHIFVPLRSL